MKPFQVTRYIKKFTAVIIAASLIAGVLFFLIAQFIVQKYTAAVVLRYPNGSNIVTSEIYSSNIISKVMDNLKMDKQKINMDSIRNSISVTPIIPEEETLLQQSVIEQGTSYTIDPNTYLVTFSSNVSMGREFPRTVLNEILDVYFNWYGENYENTSGGANNISDLDKKDYDYIEMMEVVDTFLDNTIDSISAKIDLDDRFRSYDSGYSFSDLYNEFAYIKDVLATEISADIIANTVTKNKEVLISKYNKRNKLMEITNTANDEEITKIKEIINTYVKMMKDSGNTDITYEYILDQVYDNFYRDENGVIQSQGDSTVEYDRLLTAYVLDRTTFEHNILNVAYNQYIIDAFTDAPEVSPQDQQDDIQKRITALVERTNNLYSILNVTNDEFNEYLGASKVLALCSIGVTDRIPVAMLTVFIVLVFGVLGCGGAILLGRVEDIVDYYAFTDKVDGLPNRASCDNYLAARDNKPLFGEFTIVVFRLTNLRDENARLGRETGDKMMKSFVETITGVFMPSEDVFVGNNGSGQYLVFAKGYSKKKSMECIGQINMEIQLANNDTDYNIKYSVGMAEAADDGCYNIRKLLSMAMRNMNQPVSSENPSAASSYSGVNGASEPESKPMAVNYGTDNSNVYTLGSDYYSKFKSMKKKK